MEDFEKLMNSVFGKGGRLNLNTTSEEAAKAADAINKINSASAELNNSINEQLMRQRKELESLDATAAINNMASVKAELDAQLAKDGFFTDTKCNSENDIGAVDLSAFNKIEEELSLSVLGQPNFVQKLVIAFKRPYVMGSEGSSSKNSIIICGNANTGKHFAVYKLAKIMHSRKILKSDAVSVIDLSLYPSQNEEKLFLQDLYMALNNQGEIVVFDNYESCHPALLNVLSNLVVNGKTPLSTRYTLQKGRLIDAGNALITDAVSCLTPNGKFLVFMSLKGSDRIAGSFGADFINSIGDICTTGIYSEDSLVEIADKELNKLFEKAKARLGFICKAHDTVAPYLAKQFSKEHGISAITSFCDNIYKALSQYKLENDTAKDLSTALSVNENDEVCIAFKENICTLNSLLPENYKGELSAVKAEIDKIVGLDKVKKYILSLENNIAVQQMRKNKGLKTAEVSMHMIFTGNPGTGKTTIARLISKYLKSIGALSGGQLVEVTRADLVGRYVGHTAPLTTQVIKSALGGVLFIDEAYSLYRGKDDSFGLEAIDTLVKGIEDNRDNLVVVLAGYSKEMGEFLTANSGLKSRFPNIIEFSDYTGEELLKIAHLTAESKGYTIDTACDISLLSYFDAAQAQNAAENGNGRLVRNKVEQAILNQAKRIMAEQDASLELLLPNDFILDDLVIAH